MTTSSYAYQKQWRLDNPEKHKQHLADARAVANAKDPLWQRKAELVRNFGITLDTYNEMKDAQGGVCAICKQPETLSHKGTLRSLAVDHNHKTGEVRGLLCGRCNRAIGSFKEDTEIMQSAVAYIENFDRATL